MKNFCLLILLTLILVACDKEKSGDGSGGSGGGTTPATLQITTASLADADENQAYSANLQATGGTAPYLWSTTSSLPTGLTLSSAGLLSGTPTQTGTFSIDFDLTDSATSPQTDTKALSLIVNVVPPQSTPGTFGNLTHYDLGYSDEPSINVVIDDFVGLGSNSLVSATYEDLATDLSGAMLNASTGVRTFGTANYYQQQFTPTGSSGYAHITKGDLNGDGKPDIVATAGNKSSVYLSNGNGFEASCLVYSGDASGSGVVNQVLIGDVNNDTIPDIITIGSVSTNVRVTSFINDGAGNFSSPLYITIQNVFNQYFGYIGSARAHYSKFGSGNDCGVVVLVKDFTTMIEAIYVLKVNTSATFRFDNPVQTLISTQLTSTRDLALGDFNYDGKIDIAIVGVGSATSIPRLLFMEGDGVGGFTNHSVKNLTTKGARIVATDINNNGYVDIALVGEAFTTYTYVSTVMITGGSFSTGSEVQYQISNPQITVTDITAFDVDKDGSMDLIIGQDSGLTTQKVSILYGD